MIEVEKNIWLEGDAWKKLVAESEYFGEKHITDIYYDSSDYILTRNDKWLRERNNSFELKMPMNPVTTPVRPQHLSEFFGEISSLSADSRLYSHGGNEMNREGVLERATDQYEELTSDSDIFRVLGFSREETLKESLEKNGYVPFARIITTRRKYKNGEFTIDIDAMDYGYKTGEVELMVERLEEMPDAEQKILGFIKQHGLLCDPPPPGKVIEYIRLYNKKQWQALQGARVIR